MQRSIKIYYQTVSPESAENGDFESTGEHDETIFTSIDIGCHNHIEAAIEQIKDGGFWESSSSQFHNDIWYSTVDPDRDLYTGNETTYTLHLNGYTELEQRRIYNAVKSSLL